MSYRCQNNDRKKFATSFVIDELGLEFTKLVKNFLRSFFRVVAPYRVRNQDILANPF